MSSTPLNMSITPLSTLGLIDNTPSTLPPCFLGRSPSKARTPWVEGFWAAILTAWSFVDSLARWPDREFSHRMESNPSSLWGKASVPGAPRVKGFCPEFCY